MVTRLGLGEHAENGRAAGGYVRRSGSLAAWWWGLFLGAVGCSGASDAVQLPAEVGYSVTDSAGVRAVVNTAPLWGSGEGWRVTPEPLQTLGVVDTALAQQFHEIGEVTRLRDGTVVVLNHAYLGTVKLPHDLNVREIGADYVLGVARDELGVEYVQLYGLDRGAPDTPAR